MRFADGERVRLKANPEEGWAEEYGTVIHDDGAIVMVEVDSLYREANDFDGLRECTPDQIESVS